MPNERFVEVRGLRLHVREWAGRAGEPVVLLHGWLDHCGSFDALAPLLGREEDCGPLYALDFRGHGDSAWVGPGGFYHFPEYVADLDGVLDALGLQRPRLVGHSMGGAVGLLYAAARPERLSHLTLLDAVPLTVAADEVPDRLTSWLDDLKKPRGRRTVQSVQDAADRLRRANSALPPDAALQLAQGGVSPDSEQGGKLAWKWDPFLRAHSPLPVLEPALQALYLRVKTPLLVVRAGRGYLPDEAALREKLSALPAARIEVVEGATHHLHVERPAEVAALVLREWRRASRGSGNP